MKIEEVRTSFTVYVVASDFSRMDGVAESLSLAGYMVARFDELTAAFSEFPSNPPHFLLFDALEAKFKLDKAIKQVTMQLPESHIFLVTPADQREKGVSLLEHGVYDLILTPVLSSLELMRALDRAAERDYFMYLNEQLMERAANAPAASVGEVSGVNGGFKGEEFQLQFTHQLFAANQSEECIQVFVKFASGLLSDCPIVFFRYIQNRRVLLAVHGENLNGIELNGLGLNLNELAKEFRVAHLRDPQSVAEIDSMVREVFQSEDYFALPVEAMEEIQGIVFCLVPTPEPQTLAVVREWMTLLEKALTLLESQKRLHVLSTRDMTTDLLNRQHFLLKVTEEVSRSRRTSLPVSLVHLAVDQYGMLLSQYGQEEAALVLRMVARIFAKHSRVNDLIGRTGSDEFGLILPHTDRQGALVKAERLRKIIESADFSQILKAVPRVTVSLGVSEYPSLVHDADELIQTADEALYQVRSVGNKTCVASQPDGFTPDFVVEQG